MLWATPESHTEDGGFIFPVEENACSKLFSASEWDSRLFVTVGMLGFGLVRSRLEVICVARELPRDVFELTEQSHAEWRSQIRPRAI